MNCILCKKFSNQSLNVQRLILLKWIFAVPPWISFAFTFIFYRAMRWAIQKICFLDITEMNCLWNTAHIRYHFTKSSVFPAKSIKLFNHSVVSSIRSTKHFNWPAIVPNIALTSMPDLDRVVYIKKIQTAFLQRKISFQSTKKSS